MFGRWLNAVAGILYPKVCLVCKNKIRESEGRDFICNRCYAGINKNPPPFCHCCGRHLDKKSLAKNTCSACVRKKLNFDRAFSACTYEGVIKELIHAFKYRNKDYLGPTLSALMIDFIKEYELPMDFLDFVMPVPLHKSRLREREFNQAEILSRNIAEEFGKQHSSDNLIRRKNTGSQTALENSRRIENVRGSFSLLDEKSIRGKNILLVDDVMTTASTVSEAAGVLKTSGAGIVFVLTLAS